MPTTTKRKKNPVARAREVKPFPFMQADFPVKPWVNTKTSIEFMTVSFRQDDGTYAAFIAEDETVWAVGKTRCEAEEAVKALYAGSARKKGQLTNPASVADDKEDDLRALEESLKGKFVDWQDVRHKYAR